MNSDRRQRILAAIFLAAAGLILAFGMSGCTPDPYQAPPVHAGQVIWKMVKAQDVPAACGHPEAKWIEGCAKGTMIVTRIPVWGDGELAAILQHEVAHTQGFHHIAHPDGVP